MLRGAELFLGDGVDDVGLDAINPGGSKPVEDLALDLAGQLSAHLIDRPPQATPQRHGPEILWRAQRLITIFSSDIDTLSTAVVEKPVDRLRRRDAIPGVKGGIQIGAHPAHGLQPDLVRRTPKSCAPRGNRQLSAQPYH